MARRKLQMHHINYETDWQVELTGQMHRVITTIQNTNASPEQYARITNFVHSLMHEWNRIRRALDTGVEQPKERKPKPPPVLISRPSKRLKKRKKKKHVKIDRNK